MRDLSAACFSLGLVLLAVQPGAARAQDFDAMEEVVRRAGQQYDCSLGSSYLDPLPPIYDALLTELVEQDWADSSWTNVGRYSYAYDGEAQTETHYSTWNGTDWISAWRTFFEYSGDLLSSVLHEKWEEGTWVPAEQRRCTYSSGLLTSVQEAEWQNGEWVPIERRTYEYSGSFVKRILHQGFGPSTSEWVNLRRETFYQRDGVRLGHRGDTWNASEWIPNDSSAHRELYGTIHDMDLDGDQLSFSRRWRDDTWVPGFDSVIVLDLSLKDASIWARYYSIVLSSPIGIGHPDHHSPSGPNSVFLTSDGHRWESSREFTTWNEHGRPASYTLETCCWQLIDTASFVYEDGRMREIELTVGDYPYGGGPRGIAVEVFHYDEEGHLSEIDRHYEAIWGGNDYASRQLIQWSVRVAVEEHSDPNVFGLDLAYPNPFTSSTTLTYRVATGPATLEVYDLLGRRVQVLAEGMHNQGVQRRVLNGSSLPSGHYIIRLLSGDQEATRFVTLVR